MTAAKRKMDIKFKGEFEIVTHCDLSEQHQKDVYDKYDNVEESSFFVDERNEVHDLSDFMRLENNENNEKFKSFHGYNSTSFFHSYLIILDDCGDSAKLFEIYS